MANIYSFCSQNGRLVTAFDASTGAAGETLLSTDVTTGQTYWIHRVDLLCCGSVGGRICDDSATLGRIAQVPTIDTTIAQVIASSWIYDPPIKVQFGGSFNDSTRFYLESTINGQVRGSMQYTKN
jgi:hypothetical protein